MVRLPVVQLGQSTAANDTGGQLTRETTAASATQATTTSESVQVVFLPPTARGTNGVALPASFSVSGDTLTLTVRHRGAAATYPVMVDPEASAAGDDGGRGTDAEAARTRTFKMLTWNIRGDGGPGKQPSDVPYGNLAGLIRTQKPLIILRQEVCAPDNLEKLHKELKKRHYNWRDALWVAEHGHEGDNGAHRCKDGDKMGNAILARQVCDQRAQCNDHHRHEPQGLRPLPSQGPPGIQVRPGVLGAWMRRRWKRTLVVLLVVVAVDATFVAANRPGTKTQDAVSAAITTEGGTDPSAGTGASCEFEPDAGLVVWRASYRCIVWSCSDEISRLRITHVLLGGWSFQYISGFSGYGATSGETKPIAAPRPRNDPKNCPA